MTISSVTSSNLRSAMKLVIFGIAFLVIGGAYSQTADKGVPPIAGKIEASDKKGDRPERKQEITVNLPTNFNATVSGKVDVANRAKEIRHLSRI